MSVILEQFGSCQARLRLEVRPFRCRRWSWDDDGFRIRIDRLPLRIERRLRSDAGGGRTTFFRRHGPAAENLPGQVWAL